MVGAGRDLGDDPSRSTELSSQSTLEAFDKGAPAWVEYVSTPLGRLRHELSMYYLSQHLVGASHGLRALDAGGGTGTYAIDLARRGFHVCLLDFSLEMLVLARERIVTHEPDLLELVDFRQGDVEEIGEIFSSDHFDLILCHTLLEYVAEPLEAAKALGGALRPGGLMSFLLTNPAADALRIALTRQDPNEARLALEGSSSSADLFGLSRRIVPPTEVAGTLRPLGVVELADYGVRVVADYLPRAKLVDSPFYHELLELEKEMGRLQPYKSIARYRQLLMRRSEAAQPTS
jgi:S-adenosylmethionine-dependent methyltransferase